MRPWRLPSLTFTPKRYSFGGPGPWFGHTSFAYDLIAATQPSILVELGTFYGESYFTFCQAAAESGLTCNFYAVDTWKGDDQGGHYGEEIYADVEAYNRENYRRFSHLVRATFDGALHSFSDGTIDILHIDGFHTYEACRHDFDSWMSKVRPGGIVLLHDISVRSPGFGVWRLWEELCDRYAHFSFPHSQGLGVLLKPGPEPPSGYVADLFSVRGEEASQIARFYALSAERSRLAFENTEFRAKGRVRPACPVQVFYGVAEGYTEKASITRIVEMGKWSDLIFELPAGAGLKPLRIDPSDRASVIEFSSIALFAGNRSHLLWSWKADDLPPKWVVAGNARMVRAGDRTVIASDGVDPQVFLPESLASEADGPLELHLKLRILPCVPLHGTIVPVGDIGSEYASCSELNLTFPAEAVQAKLGDIMRELNRQTEAIERLEQVVQTNTETIQTNTEALSELPQLSRTMMHSEQILSEHRSSETRMAGEINELQRALASERARREDLEASWSWRVTSPARVVIAKLRGKPRA